MSSKRELRRNPSRKLEVRKNNDGTRSVSGYFASFGVRSKDLGFREIIKRGAFSESLRINECRALVNHNSDALLGIQRTDGSGNLKVAEDNIGLRFDMQLPDTTYARDLVSLMEGGIVDQCSFAFSVPQGGDSWDEVDGELVRTLSNVTLYEGSILMSEAAYPGTSADLRSCPVSLRGKLRGKSSEGVSEDDPSRKVVKKRDDFDYDDDDLDGVCDPESDDYDSDFDAAGYCDSERQRKALIKLSLRRLQQS